MCGPFCYVGNFGANLTLGNDACALTIGDGGASLSDFPPLASPKNLTLLKESHRGLWIVEWIDG